MKKKKLGLNNISSLVCKVSKPILRKKGFFQIEIIRSWNKIIGDEYAKFTLPIKYIHDRIGGILIIRVRGSIALEIQHQILIIIDRINTYFGYKAVFSIKMIQGEIRGRDIEILTSQEINKSYIMKISEKTVARIEEIDNLDLRNSLLQLLQCCLKSKRK